VAHATTTDAPSQRLRDFITNLADEGYELEDKLGTFLASAHQAGEFFDAEVRDLDDSDERYQAAAVESGLGRLHAIREHMLELLVDALWFCVPAEEQPYGEAA
jgi:hypothetical protein